MFPHTISFPPRAQKRRACHNFQGLLQLTWILLPLSQKLPHLLVFLKKDYVREILRRNKNSLTPEIDVKHQYNQLNYEDAPLNKKKRGFSSFMTKNSLGYQGRWRTTTQTEGVKNKLWNPQNRKRGYKLVVNKKQCGSHIYGEKVRNPITPAPAGTPCKE
jgi:hypothetical protein